MKLNIVAMLWAAIVMLSMPYLHHHHHNGVVCMAVEQCDIDGADNDEHTSHHDDHTLCNAEASYFIVKSASQKDSHSEQIQLLLFLSGILLVATDLDSLFKPKFLELLFRCKSQWNIGSVGLRAPPLMIWNA